MSARIGARAGHARGKVVSWRKVAAYSVLGLTVLAALIPFLYVISASLKQQAVLFTYPPKWVPYPPDFSNYGRLFSDFPFLRWTFNTLVVATVVTVLRLTFDSLAAYGFAKMTFVGKRALFVVMLATILVPSGVLIIPLYFMARDLGWLDTYWALILPPLASPVGIFMLRAFIVGLPSELEQSARVDNCNAFQVYWWVILPLIKPGLVVVGMYHWLVTYTSFIWPLVAIENEDLFTLPLGLSSLSPIAEQRDWGLLSAAMILTMVPLTAVFILVQRHYTSVSLVGALRR